MIVNNNMYPEKKNKLEVKLGLTELTELDVFYQHPCNQVFRKLPKCYLTPELVRFAVENDGYCICSVPEKYIDEELLKTALRQDGLVLRSIKSEYLTKELFKIAVEQTGNAIEYVPKKYITKTLARMAVANPLSKYSSFPISFIPKRLIDENLVYDSVKYSPCSLKCIPEEYFSKELFMLAVSGDGAALEFVPEKSRDDLLIHTAVSTNPIALQFIPESKRTEELCKTAFEQSALVLKWIPEEFITIEMCLAYIDETDNDDRTNNIDISVILDKYRNEKCIIDEICNKHGAEVLVSWNNHILDLIKQVGPIMSPCPLSDSIADRLNAMINAKKFVFDASEVSFNIEEAELPSINSETAIIKKSVRTKSYNLCVGEDVYVSAFYYISDIHLEHQLSDLLNSSYEEISREIRKRVKGMLRNVDTSEYLLIGGDVGHYIELVKLFYKHLFNYWTGPIISVLGNHELWNYRTIPADIIRSKSVDDIVSDYRRVISFSSYSTGVSSILLQNEVYIKYKNQAQRVISEQEILNAEDDDLRDLLKKSSIIVLGGVGFSGMNERYNAEIGMYRSTVTTIEEDKALSKRFKDIYDKLERCAGDMKVIVLTHNPVHDWSIERYNPNWIYVNGHTHSNNIVRESDGTTVLSDNQIGYEPKKWRLNLFYIGDLYDPLKDMEDGIYEIDPNTYVDFNRGRGISMSGFNRPGTIYALKRNGLYMFLLRSKSSICILDGGNRKRLEHTIDYYFDNMEMYAQRIREMMKSYQDMLERISNEVKLIGGSGRIHGCIVDIDFYSHLFLNPYGGHLIPYYAIDTNDRIPYNDLQSLLKKHLPSLVKKYEKESSKGSIPLLSQYAVLKCDESDNLIKYLTFQEWISGKEIYKPSRVISALQYIFYDNIIRAWNDGILSDDYREHNMFYLEDNSIKLIE